MLDNAKVHGKKMEANVNQWLAEIAQQVTLPEFTLRFDALEDEVAKNTFVIAEMAREVASAMEMPAHVPLSSSNRAAKRVAHRG